MHGLIPRLTPLALDTLSLAETLEAFVNGWRRRHTAVAFTLRHDLRVNLSTGVSLAIYRLVQEGVTNAIRHAQPTRVDIDVRADETRVLVRIEDDGVGLAADWSQAGRFGLRGLRERVAKLEGRFEIGNRPEGGVTLFAELPVGVVS
jgi:two-component system sensor histidine kinase UhpB